MTKKYIYCTHCGAENSRDNQFCTECGNQLEKIVEGKNHFEGKTVVVAQNKTAKKTKEINEKQVKKEKIKKPRENKKIIGILSVILVLIFGIIVYIRSSEDQLESPITKEEIWVFEDKDMEGAYSSTAVKIIDNKEVWLMDGYITGQSFAGISNMIYSLKEDADQATKDSVLFKTDNLKRAENLRVPPLLFISDAFSHYTYPLEIFDIEFGMSYDYDGEDEYFDEIIKNYLDEQTFTKILNKYDSLNQYLDKKIGTDGKNEVNLSKALLEYTEEDSNKERVMETTAFATELAEAVIKENKELIKESIQRAQLESEQNFGEDGMSTAELAELEEDMRADDLEYDEFHVKPVLYLDEENLDVVGGMTDFSKSAQYQMGFDENYIFEKLSVGHPNNDYDEEILIMYSTSDEEDKLILFKED